MSPDVSGPGSAGSDAAGSAGLGFVGLDAMGGPIAGRLLARYGQLAVFDTRAEAMRPLTDAGAVACGSPAEVADAAGTVFVSLPDPEAMPAVVDGPDGLLRGCASSSTRPRSATWTRRSAAARPARSRAG